jgi:D-sedoheptulose 7-phosphate isomerase
MTGREHLAALRDALAALESEASMLETWGRRLADTLVGGGRLLAAGNGGSAAEAQHLTAELVGRYSCERMPLSAVALHADTSSLTAIANDYGPREAFARQVRAHGRPGDVLLALSTSGQSPNVLHAVEAARAGQLETWAMTGDGPNALSRRCDEALLVPGPPATVQEAHLVAIHLVCTAVDARVQELVGTTRMEAVS